MASPVSFGDVVAMSKIAWRVAHAFTKGRHSAPREFREVENQLYSLSAALAAFKDVCGDDVTVDPADLPARFRNGERDGLQTVTGILDNCRETLKHLEGIVDRYSIVAAGPKDKDPGKSRLRQWSAELLKNYRKIAWTTQAGDLAALRSQLMVHTNSLDLVLGIIVSSRTSRIEDSLRENSSMLKEIYSCLLNYQELGNPLERYNDPSLAHAELWIYYAKEKADEPADVTKSIVHLHHSTSIKTEENEARVVIQAVECQSYNQDQRVHRLEKVDVVFHMTSLEGEAAAKTLHQRLEDMRMELFITSLQYPRPDETVVLHLQATEVECEVAAISDAELLITRSRDDGQHRLIVTSRNRCTVLTQVLPDTFFAPPPSQAPSFASPTWLIQLDASGRRRVYHYPNGFRFLRFRNTSAERMFELGRNALLQGALPVRELAVREKTEDQL
ncbi:b89ab809-ace2-4622-980e-e47404ee3af5 [Thermothielavioides terrestris]|uniref:B89ab809-ace2-4622-980e-e47404ee3af5 n=1 Tax=Thermothielavioides terrestris TaxID=2587410 RepID=A0A3S4AMQ1_9PEZI|nr:b89ab809-ace2-4622-980e-e47404ee3af5 [Thermothielavioides terrestris]